jgi:hypothetical protein
MLTTFSGTVGGQLRQVSLYKLLASLPYATCPTQLILLDLFIPVFDKKYKL